jgi:2,4-dienoyl-CoA reductase-like NADH-dependent reductase (Old Yellow Enzyme family)
VPVFFGDTALNAWRDIVRAVHDRGAGIVPQIWRAPVSMDPGTGTLPSERRLDLLNAYSRAAEQIRLAGFDGVEIQSGGKHSADLFVSAGHEGSFAVEVLRILRKAVGDDFPIILRVSEWRRSDGHTPIARSDEELATLLRPCAEAGVSVFHLDTATFDSLPYSGSFTDNRPLASRVRELTGRPVIAVGSIAVNDPALTLTNLQRLALSVERDDINLLALGRAHLADPEWVEKFRSGRLGEALPYDESLRGTLR